MFNFEFLGVEMVRKLSLVMLMVFISLVIIFANTFFNQQRYYEVQERHRNNQFYTNVVMQTELNKLCLKNASVDTCYDKFLQDISQRNPYGDTKIIDVNKNFQQEWNKERHRDNRIPVEVQHIFSEFPSQPQVVFSKLTKHENEILFSLNAMFFSIVDYSEYFISVLKREPSTFENMSLKEFTAQVAWPRFYPNALTWVVTLILLIIFGKQFFKLLSLKKAIYQFEGDIHKKDKLIVDLVDKNKTLSHETHLQEEKHKVELNQLEQKGKIITEKLLEMRQNFGSLMNEKAKINAELEQQQNYSHSVASEKEKFQQELVMLEKKHLQAMKDHSDLVNHSEKERQQSAALAEVEIAKHRERSASLKMQLLQFEIKEKDFSEAIVQAESKLSKISNNLDVANLKISELELEIHHNEKEKSQNNELWDMFYSERLEIIKEKESHIQQLKDQKSELEEQQEIHLQQLDRMGNDAKSKKIFQVLIKNPDMVLEKEFHYSSGGHHSKDFLNEIYKSFDINKKNNVSGLISELRSTKYDPTLRGTLKIVKDHDLSRQGWGLLAYGKSDGGYGAYMHLTARNLGEAVLATKAIQHECSAFKGFKIKSFEKLNP